MKDILAFIRKLVSNKFYNITINFLIIISIILILFEHFVDLDPVTYNLLSNFDTVILILFAFDFTLRLVGGKVRYFLKEYGWIDLLAVLPIINPAVKGLRIIRGLRTLRFMRMLRFLRVIRVIKVIKTATVQDNEVKQRLNLLISSTLMLLLILGGGLILLYVEGILKENDIARERTIVETAGLKLGINQVKEYLVEQPEVVKVYEMSEISSDDPFLTSLTISGDFYKANLRSLQIYFSRKKSRRLLAILEAIIIIGIFLITMVIIFITSLQYDRLIAGGDSASKGTILT